MGLYVALVHYPTVNKQGATVTTSVTNFDIHDIARACTTFGVDRYFIVTPVELQRLFVERIMVHWIEGSGADYNPTRGESLRGAEVATDLAAVGDAIEREAGRRPLWVATSARADGRLMKSGEVRSRLAGGETFCLVFGTGHGLHPEVMELADHVLEPIFGPTAYNHLSVRSAVSIYLDRIMGR